MFKRIRAFPWSKSREKCMMISFRRIFEPNLYGWCIICATHLRSTYFWAASLDGNSRCRHNPSILIFTCTFCEKWKRIREGSREKCISFRKYVVHSFLCVKHLLPSSVQLHKDMGGNQPLTALAKTRIFVWVQSKGSRQTKQVHQRKSEKAVTIRNLVTTA